MRVVVIGLAVLGVLANASCKREPPAGATRTPDDDGRCEGTTPQAYAFGDQATAERAGCRAVRVYVRTARETGPPVDDERWVFCCRPMP